MGERAQDTVDQAGYNRHLRLAPRRRRARLRDQRSRRFVQGCRPQTRVQAGTGNLPGQTEMWPKVLCSSKGVLLVETSPTTIPRLLQLTITSVGYDGTTNGSFWTQVPLTNEQFDRTTRLILGGSTPLIVSPGGIWTIAASSLGFDTTHTFLGPTGVTLADGTFFGPMQDTKGTFLGIKTKAGKVTSVTPPPTSTGILQPFVRGASRTTDGKTLVYELGIYGSSTSADGKTAPLTYETWQYVEGSRKPKLIVKSNTPSLFAYQFTGGSAPVAARELI